MAERIYAFPAMREETLGNGLRMIWVPDHEQETITLALQFAFGRFSDPLGFEGLSELTVGLLQKGTVSTPCEEFARRMEFTGSSIFSEVGEEHTVIGCRMLSRFADEIVPLFWEMICSPALLPKELKTLKREMATGLNAETTEPSSIATRHFHARLFGRQHPSGRSHSIEAVRRLNREKVAEFHRRHVVPGCALMVVAGAFELQDMINQRRSAFESWRKDGAAEQSVPAPSAADVGKPGILLIDKPDLTQTTFLAGHLTPGELAPTRHELALANYVLGGGQFSSRLMAEVRSRMGKAYSVSSQLSCVRSFGMFTISTSTQNAQAAEMLKAITDVYKKFAAEGLTESEFVKAKQFVVGNMAFQLEGIGNVTEKLLWLRFYGRDNSYIEKYGQHMADLSLETTNAAIREHFSPERLTVCTVGNKKVVKPLLEQFGAVECLHYRAKVQ